MTVSAKTNLKTIADQLKVSVSTVSKALGGDEGVSKATRAKVVKVADELGYLAIRTRKLNRKLGRTNKHHFIGVMERSSYQTNAFTVPWSYFAAVSEMASDLNITLVPQQVLVSADDHAVLDPANQTPALRDGSLSGMLMMGEWSPKVLRELNRMAPCVALPFTIPGMDIDQIGLDHNGAVSSLVRHLYNLGHRRIGFFGKCHSLSWATERFAGYVNGLAQLQLDYEPAAVVSMAEVPLMEEGHQDTWGSYLELVLNGIRDGVTAWVCSSDWPGNQLHRYLVDSGLRVPHDVSIIGFDDTEPVTFGMPPLTSTHLPRSEMGKAAIKRLLLRINDPNADFRRIQFSCPMVDHGTTAPPKSRGSTKKVSVGSTIS